MSDPRTPAERIASIMGDEDSSSSRSSVEESARLIAEIEEPPAYTIDVEKAQPSEEPAKENKSRQFLIWTAINTLATIAIVSHSIRRKCRTHIARCLPISKSSKTRLYVATSQHLRPSISLSPPQRCGTFRDRRWACSYLSERLSLACCHSVWLCA